MCLITINTNSNATGMRSLMGNDAMIWNSQRGLHKNEMPMMKESSWVGSTISAPQSSPDRLKKSRTHSVETTWPFPLLNGPLSGYFFQAAF